MTRPIRRAARGRRGLDETHRPGTTRHAWIPLVLAAVFAALVLRNVIDAYRAGAAPVSAALLGLVGGAIVAFWVRDLRRRRVR